MTYVLLIIIGGQIYHIETGLTYEQCRSERVGGDVMHVINRLKADGYLSFEAKVVDLCRPEEE